MKKSKNILLNIIAPGALALLTTANFSQLMCQMTLCGLAVGIVVWE